MLPSDLYPKLIQAAGSGAAMAETSEGRQPLCAVWPVSALPAIREAMTGGRHPATWMMLEQLGARRVNFPCAAVFANINTRVDLVGLDQKLEREAAAGPQDDCLPHYHR
jgi:molybdopterin-guanine dinucleotide biosynthesis protein A